MGTGSPAILDIGAMFWMFWCYFAAPGGRPSLAGAGLIRFNRAAEECLPNGEYSPDTGAASHRLHAVRPALASPALVQEKFAMSTGSLTQDHRIGSRTGRWRDEAHRQTP